MTTKDFNNKPITLWTSGATVGIAMIAVLYQLAILLPSSLLATPAPNDGTTGIALAFLMPILLVVVVQLAAILLGGYYLIKGIYRWSKGSIVVSALISPIVLFAVTMTILNDFGYETVDTNKPIGVIILLIFVLLPLMTLSIAYNDIRYRFPRIFGKNVS
jgi:hypothetical protein